MPDGSEMTATSKGDVDPGDIWVPDAVTYRLAMSSWSSETFSTGKKYSHFEIVLSALNASNIAPRALSR